MQQKTTVKSKPTQRNNLPKMHASKPLLEQICKRGRKTETPSSPKDGNLLVVIDLNLQRREQGEERGGKMLPANKGNGAQVSFSFEKGERTELCFSLRAQPTDRIVLSNESRSPPLSAHHPLAHSVRGSQKLIMNSAGIFATESPPLLPPLSAPSCWQNIP